MNMFNLSAGRDCRKTAGRNCRKNAGRDCRKNAGSLSVILTGGATDKPCNCSSYIRTPSLKYTNSISQCQIEPTPHTPDAIVASAFVARIVLTFQSSRFAGMPLKHLWVRWPWRRTGRSSTPDLDVHKKDLFHGGTDPDLDVHKKGPFHGGTPDPDLDIHKKGPFHGRMDR